MLFEPFTYKQNNMEGVNVFVVAKDEGDGKSVYALSDNDFMVLAKVNGSVYSLAEFEKAFNVGEVNTYIDVIRIIEI